MLKNFVKERQFVGTVKSNPISDEMEEIKILEGLLAQQCPKKAEGSVILSLPL